jgi:hypothetical protein
MEKMNTLPDETIHITPRCAMHLHGHWNKVVPLMKPFILVDLNNGVKFCRYNCWSINDIHNHHISNKNLVLMNHVKIDLQWNYWRKCIPPLFPYNLPILSNKGKHDAFDGIMCGYRLTSKWTMC